MNVKIIWITGLFFLVTTLIQCDNKTKKQVVSFYNVPLRCSAAPDIGCGSRLKPLFIDTEKEKSIKESWTNRQGTVIAIVWTENENEKLIQSLFLKNKIAAKLIFDSTEVKKVSADFKHQEEWLKGMEVDRLSIEEAGVIADSLTKFAEEEKLINPVEFEKIHKDFEEYFKKELVIVRTYENLISSATQNKWMKDVNAIYEKHIGKLRADSVRAFYAKYRQESNAEKSCCDKTNTSLQSEITCPKCGHKKIETMPTDVCLLKYVCEKCKKVLFPKDDDCCVFCSYGTNKCPSKQ